MNEVTQNPFTARLAAGAGSDSIPIETPAADATLAKTEKAPIGLSEGGALELRSIEQVYRLAQLLHRAHLLPSSFRNPEQITVAILRALELKLLPLQALEGMSVINGRVGLMGDLALSLVESSGLLADKKVRYTGQGESLKCTVTLARKGRDGQSYSFSVAEAKAAGIYERSAVWRQYPRRMTYYRALGFGLRDEFSDVLKGIKTAEELMDYPDANTSNWSAKEVSQIEAEQK